MMVLRILAIVLLVVGALVAAYYGYRRWRDRVSDPNLRARAERRKALAAAYRTALKRLAEIEVGEGGRYRIPWCLVIGTGTSDHQRLLSAAALRRALPIEESAAVEGLNWYFFERGVAIDLPRPNQTSGTGADDDREWRTVLTQVRRARPDRPIDAVTVAIPASDLFGDNKLSLDDTRQKAEELYRRLAEVQRSLRVRFPVYVVVTECEVLRGFTSFYRAVPEVLRDDMFGWSSPHPPEAVYQPAWLTEAFDSICEANVDAQLEIFAGTRVGLEEREKLLLLNDDIRTLSERLGIFLDQFLRTSVYHEAVMLRGIYLSGNDVPADVDPASTEARPVFLSEVFDHRVFAELGLASPTFIGVRSRSRIITGLKIACGVLAAAAPLGLWLSWDAINGDARVVKEAVEAVDGDVAQIVNAGPKAWPPEPVYFGGYVEHLNALIGALRGQRLFYLRVPGSWIGSLRGDVDRQTSAAFERVELASISKSLLDRTNFIIPRRGSDRVSLRATDASGSRGDGTYSGKWPVVAPTDSHEFVELNRFADDLALLEEHVKAYNSLPDDGTDTAPVLNKLSLYLYSLDQGNRIADSYVRSSIGTMTHAAYLPRIEPPTRAAAEKQANLLIDRFHDRLYKVDSAYLQLNQVRDELEDLTNHGLLVDYQPEEMVKPLYQLNDNLDQLSIDLKANEESWLAGRSLDIGKPYRDLEESLRTSKLFGPDVAEHLRIELTDYFPTFREELKRLETRATGPLLAMNKVDVREDVKDPRHAEGAVTGAPRHLETEASVERLGLQLKAVLGESYMGREPPPQRGAVSSGCTPLPDRSAPALGYAWDKGRLQEALGVALRFDFLVRDHLHDADDGKQPLVNLFERTALSRVHRQMRYIVENAHRQLPAKIDEDMQIELDSLVDVRETLGQILSSYARHSAVGMPEATSSVEELTRFLRAESYSLIARITNKLIGGGSERGLRLYGSASDKIEQWDWAANTNPAVVAFGADLKPYLDKQRSSILDLSKKANSALVILDLAPPGKCDVPDQVAAWTSIKTQLELYDRMTPGNSLQKLEHYVLDDLTGLTLDTCLERLPRSLQRQGQDYFVDRLWDIISLVRASCDRRVAQRIDSDYLKLFHDFNESLSDRYPFSGKAEESERNVPTDLAHIRAFLDEMDAFRPLWLGYLNAHAGETGLEHLLGGGFRYVKGFVTQMNAVKTFFAAFVSDPTTDNFVCEVATEFRVNRRHEVNANQIAEWWLELNGRRIDASRVQWHVGDRLRVLFRWAKNGQMVPAREQKVRWAQADKDDSVAFTFSGQWSLIELLKRHQPGADLGSTDSGGSTLRFDVDTEPRRAAAEGSRARYSDKATVFVKFAVSAPRSEQQAPFPLVFPRQAPSLSASVASR